ncbi:ATP-NAD kinase-like domain-containing protein [Dunaliella salina]|uniref:ATP-NAD kinase-like domain-containing protein n=1 Tax=Dunaliella salina TaxID=3046 RepID=A0ABQ7GSE3_DUNSA|nr:ATP-NAD kinase-like domain-containing protein [Dunaliella salina]|eukprot:KAF5837531.1 ATP-NAD kinase-like domain-containing protein [Dunaliella salina]
MMLTRELLVGLALLKYSSIRNAPTQQILTVCFVDLWFFLDCSGPSEGSQWRQTLSPGYSFRNGTSWKPFLCPSPAGVMVTLRMRMECQVIRSHSEEPTEVQEVLNELVIDRGSSSFLTNIECYEKGRYITRVQADGIMLATPTGSTAYSVSAGGSMVHPNVPAMLLTPICPHSLSFRPIILPDYAEIELRIPVNARSPAWVCFDGRSRQELQGGDKVRVKMSENPMPTINRTDLTGDWFDSLDRCFRWSDRLEQKPAWSDEKPAGKDAFR